MKLFRSLTLLSIVLISLSSANVMGIDFGSNFISFGLLKSGKPITVVRNENEKRLTPALVTVDGRERFVGVRSQPKSGRQSFLTANNIIQLLGRSEQPPNLAFHYPRPQYILDDDRGTLRFNSSNLESPLAVETLAALILEQAQKTTAKFQDVIVKDIVVTVPSYFTHSQRSAILDAAKIADLTVLAILESNLAAAYQYGMERSRTMANVFEQLKTSNETAREEGEKKVQEELKGATRHVLFVDMGGSQTSLSLVQYEFPRPNVTVEVKKTKLEKAQEAKRKREEEKKRKEEEALKSATPDATTDEDEDEEEELETEQERAKRKQLEREAVEDDEEDSNIINISISGQAEMQAFMKQQEEMQRKRKRREERNAKLNEIRTVRRKKHSLEKTDADADASKSSFDPQKYLGRLEVFLTESDESLGGRQIDALIADHFIRILHNKAAPEEVAQYGDCQPYLPELEFPSSSTPATPANATGCPFSNFPRSFPTPINPRQTRGLTPYPGPKCRRMLDSPSTLPALFRTASVAKEILTVAPEWHGSLDDMIAEAPDVKVSLTREEFEAIAAPVFDRFRALCQRFKAKYDRLAAASPELNLAETCPLESVVVQIMGGSMRIPALQQIALDVFGKKELGRLLNVDEAAALGSTYFAASLLPKYNVKGVLLVEHATRAINVRIRSADGPAATPAEGVARLPSPESLLYPSMRLDSPHTVFIADDQTHARVVNVGEELPLKKKLIIPRGQSFTLSFDYETECCCCDEHAKDHNKAKEAGKAEPCNCTCPLEVPSLPLPLGVSPHILAVNVSSSASKLSLFHSPVEWATQVTVELSRDGILRVRKAKLDVIDNQVVEDVVEKVTKAATADDELTEEADDEEQAAEKKKAEEEKEKEKKTRITKRRTRLDLKLLKNKEDRADADAWRDLCAQKAKEGGEGAKKDGEKEPCCCEKWKRSYEWSGDTSLHYFPIDKQKLKDARTRVEAFNTYEKDKEAISEARNRLEAYVFDKKDLLTTNRAQLLKLALEEQIDGAMEVLEKTSLWLEDEEDNLIEPPVHQKGEKSTTLVEGPLEKLVAKLEEATAVCHQLDLKLKEATAFPLATSKMKKLIQQLKEKQDEAVVAGSMNETEADDMEDLLDDALDWVKDKEAEKKSTPRGMDVPVTSAQVLEQMAEVEKRAQEMLTASERRMKLEKYNKERMQKEAKKQKEKEKLLREKRLREEKKKRKLREEGGYDEILEREEEEEKEKYSKTPIMDEDEDDDDDDEL